MKISKIMHLMLSVVIIVIFVGCGAKDKDHTKKATDTSNNGGSQVTTNSGDNEPNNSSYSSNSENQTECDSSDLIEIGGLKKYYKENEIITFSIDTKGTKGYLYLFVIDDIETVMLQPSSSSPLVEIQGKYIFPRDFTDRITLRTSKNCTDCKEEKTTVYALLTNIPVDNIKELLDEQIKKTCWSKINENSNKLINIGKIEFFVE
ncbi:MAG TPA: hypothetical protein ENK88_00315 [Campylobacterales bacterium]|nr:hypothetical protein [Campylobacterales bacterium]